MKNRLFNQHILYPAICCLSAILWGCSNEVGIGLEPAGSGEPIRILAEIEQNVPTKTAIPTNDYERTSFVDGDKILVIQTYNGSKTKQQNYSYTQSSGWSYAGNAPVTLQATATYQAQYPAAYDGILQNQNTAENYRKSNKLVSGSVISTDGTVSFTGENAFKHVNTKITFNFEGENALSGAFTNTLIQGKGLYSGKDQTESISLLRPDDTQHTWCGIIYPADGTSSITDFDKIDISLTYQGVNYKVSLTCARESGKHYIYTLTIRNKLLIIKSNTIGGWLDGGSVNGDYNEGTIK